jgi:hypothetical protein
MTWSLMLVGDREPFRPLPGVPPDSSAATSIATGPSRPAGVGRKPPRGVAAQSLAACTVGDNQKSGAYLMDHYNVMVLYADGTTSALASDALNAAEAKREIIGRLAEQLIEWPPQCCPQDLDFVSRRRSGYCPACFDDSHAASCPSLTRTGQA